MILLKRNEEIDKFQVELILKEKTKQSPFIGILILADELNKDGLSINSISLQEKLLPILPLRACENLLFRLFKLGYLDNDTKPHFYRLTEKGRECAIDQSFWIGEKGLYNVYVSKSNLIGQSIIKIEKIDRAEDDRDNKVLDTPNEIKKYENKILTINKTELFIENVDQKCFKLQSPICNLEIQAKGNETILRLSNNDKLLFQTEIEIEEELLKEEILSGCRDYEYDKENNAVLTDFKKDNLSFNRNIIISNPIFKKNSFNAIELDNVAHIPSDDTDANLWYSELLYKNINQYFFDEKSFKHYADELNLYFKEYSLETPEREEFLEQLRERDDSFYQIAKIETIDFLKY